MNLALFDFDDTITTREVFRPFLAVAVAPHRIAIARVVLAPVGLGYRLGLISGAFVRACIIRFGFTGVALADLQATGRDFADATLPSVMRPEALARLDWHRAQGDRIVVVSGSLDLYLAHWCEERGIELICSSLEHRNGRLTGRYEGEQCFGLEKARRVRAAYDLAAFPVIYAYGDSKDDLDMIGLAHKKFYQWKEVQA